MTEKTWKNKGSNFRLIVSIVFMQFYCTAVVFVLFGISCEVSSYLACFFGLAYGLYAEHILKPMRAVSEIIAGIKVEDK